MVAKYNQQPDLNDIETNQPPSRTRHPQPARVEVVIPTMPQAVKSLAGFVCEALALVCRLLEAALEIVGMAGRLLDVVTSWLSGICDKVRRYLIGIAHNL